MELKNKLVLHIPEKAWCENHMEDIDIDAEMGDLLHKLENAGVSSFYIQNVTGYYKGREYPERLLVIFCDFISKASALVNVFENWLLSHNGMLRQEAFSYEWNGELIVKETAFSKINGAGPE